MAGCVCGDGGKCGRGVCMAGARMVRGACVVRGHVWQERRPLKRAVRILLECIPILDYQFGSVVHLVSSSSGGFT